MRFARAKSGIAVLTAMLVVVGVGGALALNSTSGARVDTVDSGAIATPMRLGWLEGSPPRDSAWWTPITVVALTSLPAGTRIVNCWGKIKRLPRGVRLEVVQGFYKEHPGFYFLTDGRCASDPSAIPTSMRNSRALEAPTRAFDLQWFGTGVDGGPPVGGSSCFVGDPLNNHCGIPTNVRTSPMHLASGGMLPPKPSAP